MDCVIGIDVGTTSTSGILVGMPDQVLARASRPVSLSSPFQGWTEQDPEQWWDNTCAIVAELIAMAGVAAADIKGIGVTGMLPALVTMDRDGVLLRPSIQQSDGRTGAEVAEIAAEIDEAAFLRKTGNGINQQLIAPKPRWLEKREPEVFSRIATVFGSYDFINWKLTGRRAVEQNWALEAGFTDLATGTLSAELIGLGHVPPWVVPRRIVSHEVLGHVTAAAARATGLPEGVPVIGGAADHIASGFAAGVTEPGDVLLKFGGAADILIATATAVPDARMFLDYHLTPGRFMPNGCMACGGSALNWFADKIAGGEVAAAAAAGLPLHRHLDQIAAHSHPAPTAWGRSSPISWAKRPRSTTRRRAASSTG